MKLTRLLLFGTVLLVMCFAYACGKDDPTGPTGSSSWQCNVTLTLNPATFGDISSPSGTGTGRGTGATQDQALSAALKEACSQLNLSGGLRSQCESGRDFMVSTTVGGITLVSTVSRSRRCWGGN